MAARLNVVSCISSTAGNHKSVFVSANTQNVVVFISKLYYTQLLRNAICVQCIQSPLNRYALDIIIAYDIYMNRKSLNREFGRQLEREVSASKTVKCQLFTRGRAIPQNDIIRHILGRDYSEEAVINSLEIQCFSCLTYYFYQTVL